MTQFKRWLTFLLCFALAGCSILDKFSGNRKSSHPNPDEGQPVNPHPGAVQSTPTPTRLHSPRPPQTISKKQFTQSQSELDERTKSKAQTIAFVNGLKILAGDSSNTQKRAEFSELIAEAKLTGKIEPDADALNNYYQNPNTSIADKRALDAAMRLVLSKRPKKP
jgi:hypothetical protein